MVGIKLILLLLLTACGTLQNNCGHPIESNYYCHPEVTRTR